MQALYYWLRTYVIEWGQQILALVFSSSSLNSVESNLVASHLNASNLTFEVVNNQLPHGGSVTVYSDSSNIQGQESDGLQSIDENIPIGLESFQSKFVGKYGSQHGVMCDARLRWRASSMTGFEAANEVSHGGFEEHAQKFGE